MQVSASWTDSRTMGSTHSRPGLHKVGPCNILQEKTQKPKPQWTVPVLPHATTPGSVGEKRTTFPPLKQEITLSLLSGQSAPNFIPSYDLFVLLLITMCYCVILILCLRAVRPTLSGTFYQNEVTI